MDCCADIIEFDLAKFRTRYPQFSDVPDLVVEDQWNLATCYISDCDYGWLRGSCRESAIYMMTAHLVQLNLWAQEGQVTGQLQSATIDKVTVSLNTPPNPNQWQFYLGQTPYGQQLLALLEVAGVGGLTVPSLPELSAFRRVGGVFI